MKPRGALLLFLGLYAGLALGYIDATPYRTAGRLPVQGYQKDIGAPDERQHVNYVRYLVSKRSFPVFKPDSADLYETYQAHQPPLYYLLCAPLSAAVGTAPIATEKWALRLVNVGLGCLLLIGIYAGVRGFSGNEPVALFCAGFVGFLPMFLALSSAVTNDVLLYLMVVWAMNQIAFCWGRGWSVPRSAALGLIIGLALLTKTSSIVLLPTALAAMLVWREHRARPLQVLVMLVVAAFVASPWLIRNQLLYGDPLAVGAFQQAFVGTKSAKELIASSGAGLYWLNVIQAALMSWWGIFSYFEAEMHYEVYVALTALTVAAGVGLAFRILRSRDAREAPMHGLNAVLLSAVLAGFVRFNMVYYQAQARYLYPAVFAVACGVGFGFWEWAGRWSDRAEAREVIRRFWVLAGAFLAILFFVNLYVLALVLPYWFTRFTQP